MEVVEKVPGPGGLRPVYLAHLAVIDDWPSLLADPDWERTAGDPTRPIALFTTSGDPAGEMAWHDLADYCVQHAAALVCSWGPNTTVLDDAFDMAAVMRHVDNLPTSDPRTTWHDDEPLSEALDFFLGYDLSRTSDYYPSYPTWDRFVLVVGDVHHLAEARRHLVECCTGDTT
jgi:hypothetical protein